MANISIQGWSEGGISETTVSLTDIKPEEMELVFGAVWRAMMLSVAREKRESNPPAMSGEFDEMTGRLRIWPLRHPERVLDLPLSLGPHIWRNRPSLADGPEHNLYFYRVWEMHYRPAT